MSANLSPRQFARSERYSQTTYVGKTERRMNNQLDMQDDTRFLQESLHRGAFLSAERIG